ncbi:hypothetical protein Hamer_G018681 [Homarus americanus]|uniref:Uncharacterized protein n=1 Tax=Homarus americanus TaxID=6706 RepID=A0A8J5N5Q7_HOMAM|nr:hypothetical protein Hamer_G018681 [Homarus americanus]
MSISSLLGAPYDYQSSPGALWDNQGSPGPHGITRDTPGTTKRVQGLIDYQETSRAPYNYQGYPLGEHRSSRAPEDNQGFPRAPWIPSDIGLLRGPTRPRDN